MLIDAHVHLQEAVLLDQLDEVMAACAAEGIGLQLCNGTKPADWADVSAIAARYSTVLPCYGVHPWFVDESGEHWEGELRGFLSRRASLVGECGIDRWIEPRDEKAQEVVFRRHLAIARELDRPIVIHCLRAWGWLMDILGSESLPRTMQIHSYGGSAELIGPLAASNAYFSFSANIFEAKRGRLRDVVKVVPADRLLIETDAPAMTPPPRWRKYEVVSDGGEVQNHPADLTQVYAGVAELRGCSLDDLVAQVQQNVRTFLGELWDGRE